MMPSKQPDKGGKADPGKPPLLPNPRHSKNIIPSPAGGRQQGRNTGRQAYTTHVVRHDRRHHKPGR